MSIPHLRLAPHDLVLQHEQPVVLKMNDPHLHNVNVGSVIELSGHDTMMDRQKFQVVAKMDHANLHEALSMIDHSNLDVRDKIQMHENFVGLHGAEAAHQPVTSLHLAPHPAPMNGSFNRGIGGF